MLRKIPIVAVGLALLVGSLFLVMVEYASLRSGLVASIEVQMRIVADNSVAALLFHDQVAAMETLSTFAASYDVDAAAIYTVQKSRFAEYIRAGTTTESLSIDNLRKPRSHVGLLHMELWQPVIYAGNSVGTLYVRANLSRLYRQLLWYIATTTLVMLATLFATRSGACRRAGRIFGELRYHYPFA